MHRAASVVARIIVITWLAAPVVAQLTLGPGLQDLTTTEVHQ